MGIRLVARKIFRVKNGVDRDIIYRIRSAEYRGYALDDTAVVFDAFEASGDGLSRSGGCEKKHNFFPRTIGCILSRKIICPFGSNSGSII